VEQGPLPVTAAMTADRSLVERIQAGEAIAFQELFHRYRRLVYGLACRLLNDAEEAHDLCQEVFLTVHRRIGSLRDSERLRPWICRITVTRAYNIERSFRRRFRNSTVSLERWPDSGEEQIASGDNPERDLVSAEARARIGQALAELPFLYRTVVVLRDVEGLSYEEIAEAIHLNIGTVKSRLSRGRETLREKLGDLLRAGRAGS
jgi:RNA polymerase sigma-70 factor (ECF subfamily)